MWQQPSFNREPWKAAGRCKHRSHKQEVGICDRNLATPVTLHEPSWKPAHTPTAASQSKSQCCPTMQEQAGLWVSEEEQEHLEEYHLPPRTHISDEIDNLWLQIWTKASANASQPRCKITTCVKIIQPCISGSWLSSLSSRTCAVYLSGFLISFPDSLLTLYAPLSEDCQVTLIL